MTVRHLLVILRDILARVYIVAYVLFTSVAKVKLGIESSHCSLVLESDGTEVDEDAVMQVQGETLMMLAASQNWMINEPTTSGFQQELASASLPSVSEAENASNSTLKVSSFSVLLKFSDYKEECGDKVRTM